MPRLEGVFCRPGDGRIRRVASGSRNIANERLGSAVSDGISFVPMLNIRIKTPLRIAFSAAGAFWLFAAAPASATTMVMIRTGGELAIAVDSQDTVTRPNLPDFRRPICKLFMVQETFFAVAGLIHSGATKFSAPEIVSRELRKNLPASDRFKSAEQPIASALSIVIAKSQESDPRLYQKLVAERAAIAIFLATIDNKIPVAAELDFGVTAREDNTINTVITRHLCPDDCLDNGLMISLVGRADLINKRLHEGAVPHSTPAELAQFMVQIVVDANVPEVAGPIDVVRLRPGEPPWIKAKVGCPIDLTQETAPSR
jgi:hypothetical protein